MFITFENNLYKPYEQEKTDIIDIALFRIHCYKMTFREKNLNNFLQQQYHKNLKTICKNLVKNKLVINWDTALNTIIINFKDYESDKLAQLITYGNEHTLGSNILKFALNQEL